MKTIRALQSEGPKPAPFVKWAGGKGQLVPELRALAPKEFGTYFEPFLGGGAMFFALEPANAVLTDLNRELITTYQVIQRDPEALMAALDAHQPHGGDEDYFRKVRAKDPEKMSDVKRAARFIFLNKTCFNGLYRVNSKGQFNTPFNHNKKAPRLYDRANVLACHRALQGKLVSLQDYQRIAQYAKAGDFVYFDPPYQPLSATSSFTSYTAEDFTFEDQQRLADVVDALVARGCKVMLSNSAHPDVEALYSRYPTRRIKARRAINSDKSGRGAIDELLVVTYLRD